jgi:hypothetical protein
MYEMKVKMSAVKSFFKGVQYLTRFIFSFGECLWAGYAFFVPHWDSFNHIGLLRHSSDILQRQYYI